MAKTINEDNRSIGMRDFTAKRMETSIDNVDIASSDAQTLHTLDHAYEKHRAFKALSPINDLGPTQTLVSETPSATKDEHGAGDKSSSRSVSKDMSHSFSPPISPSKDSHPTNDSTASDSEQPDIEALMQDLQVKSKDELIDLLKPSLSDKGFREFVNRKVNDKALESGGDIWPPTVPLPDSPTPVVQDRVADATLMISEDQKPDPISPDTSPVSHDTSPIPGISNILRRIPRPRFPIRVYDGGPYHLSLDAQERITKWKYGWPWNPPSPKWMIKPSHERIKETVRPYLEQLGHVCHDIEVEFLAEGSFNKVYVLRPKDQQSKMLTEYIFRTTVPIEPYYKLESDVATMEIVRHFTQIPVPIVYAFDSSMQNPVGLEWMLMEKIEGRTLHDPWNELDSEHHMHIIKAAAQWTKQLATIQSDKIGSIYMSPIDEELVFYVGRALQWEFTNDKRTYLDFDRGPFSSLHGFYAAVLDVTIQDFECLLANIPDIPDSDSESSKSEDEDDADSYSEEKHIQKVEKIDKHNASRRHLEPWRVSQRLEACEMFRDSLHLLCDKLSRDPPSLTTYLMHNDLSKSNIMIDDTGKPLAVLDWEFTVLLPLSVQRPTPVFLDSDEQSQEPPRRSLASKVKFPKWSDLSIEQHNEMNQRAWKDQVMDHKLTKYRAQWSQELRRADAPISTMQPEDLEYALELFVNVLNCGDNPVGDVQWINEKTGQRLNDDSNSQVNVEDRVPESAQEDIVLNPHTST